MFPLTALDTIWDNVLYALLKFWQKLELKNNNGFIDTKERKLKIRKETTLSKQPNSLTKRHVWVNLQPYALETTIYFHLIKKHLVGLRHIAKICC